MKLEGLHAALIASYDDTGALSLERQAALIDHVLSRGVDGIFVSGSTGEAYLQSVDERKATISASVEQMAGRGPVIAHTAAMDTRTSLELTEHAVATGADAVSAVTPIYYHYEEAEHEQYYRAVASAAGDTPVIAYHIPGQTHVDLGPEFFVRLAEEGVLQGLKYTSTDLYPLAEAIRQFPPGFVVYNGSDEVLLGGLSLGAVGGIGSTYNAIGAVYARVRDALAAGDLDAARAAQYSANEFIQVMNGYGFIAFLREVLRYQGVETGTSRKPLPSLTSEAADALNSQLGRLTALSGYADELPGDLP